MSNAIPTVRCRAAVGSTRCHLDPASDPMSMWRSKPKTRFRRLVVRHPTPDTAAVSASEIEEGILHILEISELRKVGIWSDAGGMRAFDLQCPHMGADLSEGWIDDDTRLHCPWHGYLFSPRDGSLTSNPNVGPMRVARERSPEFDPELAPRCRLRMLPLDRVGDDLHIRVRP